MSGDLLERPVTGLAQVRQANELAQFLEADCAALVWRRSALADFQNWLDTLPVDHFPVGRLVLRPQAIGDAMAQLCDMCGLAHSAERELLINDVAVLGDLFAGLMEADYVRLRLEKVTDNACRKFHRDTLTARLVCTYRGPGTEFGLGRGDQDPDPIHAVPAFSPILLRGNQWLESPNSGLVHRSPPIEGTGQTRFVMVLDPIFDLEGEKPQR
ncbi:MAG: DUF1826 domain-containing protein [Rhizobiaceae bacterium]|nr:DUF1826 domain-containing protein [Rhizobiaceae bacterium]